MQEGTAEIENRGQINVPMQIEGEKWMCTLNCAIHNLPLGRAQINVSKLKVRNGCTYLTTPPTAHASGNWKSNSGAQFIVRFGASETLMSTLIRAAHCPCNRALHE